MKMDKNLIKEIIKTRNAVRRKFKALRTGRIEAEAQFEETFKPITKPLKEFVANAKSEPKDEKEQEHTEMETPPKRKYLKMETTSTPIKYGDFSLTSDDEFTTPTHSRTLRGRETDTPLNMSGSIVSKYLKMYTANSQKIDYTYGIYYDSNSDEWRIGNSTLEVDVAGNITIKDKIYKGTLGLCELLFMKDPVNSLYTDEDLTNYETILKDTSAYKRNYDEEGQTRGSKGSKYKNIISKLIQHKGMGLMQLPKENIDHIYWDDPNELVDRLRLLIASKQAGNNSHDNEIVSIIEELREADIIV